MRILKLKLRGAIGIKLGKIGLDEIEIDFTQFGPGLVALVGVSGSGKSTILENCHPYRTMVSRSGSLQSHFFLKDSYRILFFEFDGLLYESKILIDALTGASEAYLFRVRVSSKEVDNLEREALNDGKLTTYDAAIEKLLGSQDLFFNSVFSGQKSKGIAELKPADRRKLFYELLNLNVYDQYLENAKSKLKSSEIKLAEIEGQINSIDVTEATKTELEEARVKALNGIADAEISISKLEAETKQFDSSIREAEIEIAKLEEKQKANDEINLKRNAIKTKSNELLIFFVRELAKLNSDLDDTKKLISNYQKLLTRKDEIEMNVVRIQNLEINIENSKELKSILLEKKNESHKQYYEADKIIQEKLTNLLETKKGLLGLENNCNNAIKSYNDCLKESNLIDKVPCDEITGIKCQFLSNAHASKKNLIFFNSEVDRLKLQVDMYRQSVARKENEINPMKEMLEEKYSLDSKEISASLENVEFDLTKFKSQLDPIKSYKQLADQLKNAEMEVKILTEKLTNISELINDSKISHEKQLEELSKESFDLLTKYDSNIFEKIIECKDVLKLNENKKDEVEIKLNNQKTSLDHFKRNLQQTEIQIDEIKKNEEKISKLQDAKIAIQTEIKDYSFLTKAFDKTGIPVLKLENSGIEITSIANELLSLFENKFRIVFETTKLKADKKSYKESFDINIINSKEIAGISPIAELGNKSGGEKTWIETAIQLSIILLIRQKGKTHDTSFLDEKDGSLDLDSAYSYAEMIKKAHQMSGVHNTFIITHRSELLDFIPQQIKLADGLLSILN